jgi:hypothetical protein
MKQTFCRAEMRRLRRRRFKALFCTFDEVSND